MNAQQKFEYLASNVCAAAWRTRFSLLDPLDDDPMAALADLHALGLSELRCSLINLLIDSYDDPMADLTGDVLANVRYRMLETWTSVRADEYATRCIQAGEQITIDDVAEEIAAHNDELFVTDRIAAAARFWWQEAALNRVNLICAGLGEASMENAEAVI